MHLINSALIAFQNEKEGINMVRVDLFHPWTPSMYGTASCEDIVTVCGAAIVFCAVVGLIVFEVVQLALV